MKDSPEKNVHSGHRARVKAQAVSHGFSGFRDHQLLELFLFYSVPRADTNALAHSLIAEFGSLSGVLNAPVSQLLKVKGIGEQTAVLIASAGEIHRRASTEGSVKRTAYRTREELFALASSFFIGAAKEKLVLLCFDASKRLKKSVIIAEGTAASTEADVRKIVETVLDTAAVSVILVHNHPDSVAAASLSDVDSTRSILVMLRRLGCLVSDHIIVGRDGNCYSMADDPRFSQFFH